jgi:membrane-bound lytic murein transglycosylase F
MNGFMRLLTGVLLVSIFFGSCINRTDDSKDADIGLQIPTSAETTGKLVALLDNNLSSYYVHKGQPRGFEYELLKWFCKDHGLKLEVKIISTFDYILDTLIAGGGDLAAANFTITRSRLERVQFSPYILKSRMVLVQRLPANHLMLSRASLQQQLVTDALELDGKKLHVHQASVFYTRLKNYADENGLNIQLIPADPELETDMLIRMVSEGIIDYTVVDENIGRLQVQLYPNLHIETPLSLNQAIGWAMRKDSDSLFQKVHDWVLANRYERKFKAIYQKYFYPSRSTIADMQSSFNLGVGGAISPFDEIIKKHAAKIDMDWRLLAALIYHESRFMPEVVSPFGASGLMQVIPTTAQRFGVSEEEIFDPERNIVAGTGFLKYLYSYWNKKLTNKQDIDKFVLAAYNVGLGHVIDARNLAEKFGKDQDLWDDSVEEMLQKKSKPEYYNDSVVKHGYCRGNEPVMYVSRVLEYFGHYRRVTEE